MKKTNIARVLQWLVVLAALALAATQVTFVSGAAHWLVTIAIGLCCLGFGEADFFASVAIDNEDLLAFEKRHEGFFCF